MPKRVYAALFLLGLVVAWAGASLQTTPGYMDAYYYFYGGQRLAHGNGFSEMILWNYLDDPAGLPHPSHGYWMPLASLLAAAGIKSFPHLPEFEAAQWVFVLLAACIPPLAARMSLAFTGERKYAWLSGGLALFLGYYQPFLTATDAFSLYILLGGLFFLAFLQARKYRYLILGILAGLMHLSRADGILWVGVAGIALIFDLTGEQQRLKAWLSSLLLKRFWHGVAAIVAGYLLVIAPWFARNLNVYGSLLAPGGSRTLWALAYDELFIYPAGQLTFARWWAAGMGEILIARGEALLLNLQTSFASIGIILPGVFAVLGAWQRRREKVVWLGGAAWLALLAMMTLVFPFSGTRGSFFHSGAAFLPLVVLFAPLGVDALSAWSVKTFKWKTERIRPFYLGVLYFFALVFSLVLYVSGVFGLDAEPVAVWNESAERYAAVEEALTRLGAAPDEIIVTAEPPSYVVVTGRPAIGVPDGNEQTLLALAERYHARFVLVEESHPEGLESLYLNPHDVGPLIYVETIGDVHLFVLED